MNDPGVGIGVTVITFDMHYYTRVRFSAGYARPKVRGRACGRICFIISLMLYDERTAISYRAGVIWYGWHRAADALFALGIGVYFWPWRFLWGMRGTVRSLLDRALCARCGTTNY